MNETRFRLSYDFDDFLFRRDQTILKFFCSSSSPLALFTYVHWCHSLQWTAFVALAIILIYYVLLLPLNIKRVMTKSKAMGFIIEWLKLKQSVLFQDLSDVGFDYLTDGYYRSSVYGLKNKKELVREVQRLRKLGDVPPAFPNGWFPLMESENLKKNEVRDVAALGEHFAIFRDDRGKVRILDAYCPHLGANMAIGGAVRGGCLECPFHGWKFDGETGKCVAVPYSDRVPEFVKVKKWPATEVNSLIFVWYHAEDEKPSWYPRHLEPIKNRSWMCHGRSEFLIGCHIQDISENGGDIAHLNAIHAPSLFSGHDLRFVDKFYGKFLRHVWTGEWEPNPAEQHSGIMSLGLDTRLFDTFSLGKMNVSVEQVGPAYAELKMKGTWGTMILLQAVTPVEPHLQKVVNRIYAPLRCSITAKLMLYGELIMFERDIMIWNHKKYLSKPQLVKEEKCLARHRRWYSQFYSKNSPKFSFRNETLDW